MTDITPSAEQLAILEHGRSPLRVEAGAGTGKTTTLALRVLALMDYHGISPDQILGVTFTNKAAQELAERIVTARSTLRSPDGQVDVFTYHGFAAQLLSTHGARIGVERDVQVISPTFSRQLLVDSVRTSPFVEQDITHRPTITSSLLRLANDLADNLATPADVLTHEPTNEVELKRHELATTLTAYDVVKRELGVVDYGDLIRLTVELLRRHPFIANSVREQYKCVLLDEYQDTNPAQRELFQRLFAGGDTAVTAVGDPDQTIYEWRGATPDNFAHFPEHFPAANGTPAPSLPLTVNRRSGQTILDLANRLRLELTTTEPGLDLVADDRSTAAHVHVSWLSDARTEAESIAEELIRLHAEQNIAWSDMAVLFRKNKDIALVRDALDEFEVPLQVANLGGLLGIPEIVEIRAWLRILADPEDAPALARILFGSTYRLGMADLAPLSRWAATASRAQTEDDVLDHTLIEALDHLDNLPVSDEVRRRLEDFAVLHRRLLTLAQGASLIELTREILTTTGAWHELDAMPYPAGLSARLNVHRFLDLVEDWSPLEGRPSLEAFLTYLELMAEDPVEELDTARVGTADAVTLMTIHRAKGLEWEAVFLPALYHNNFPSSGRTPDPSLRPQAIPAALRLDPEARENLDPSRADKARESWLKARHLDQEWRLAYVAVTRAKKHLYLSGAQWYGVPEPNKRPTKPSRLLEISRDATDVVTDAWIDVLSDRPVTLRFHQPETGPDTAFGVSWDAAIRSSLADPTWPARRAAELDTSDLYDAIVTEFQETLFSLPEPELADVVDTDTRVSVTGLVTYADCPKRFYWSEVDRLPRRPSRAARRGTELHRRIELFSRGIVPFDELTDDLYDRADGEAHGATGGGWTAFAESRYASDAPHLIEMPFEMAVRDGAWIRGRVDAVYGDETHWEIVDFKSGRRSSRASATVQLEAYALAARSLALGPEVPDDLRVSFVYLGDGLDVVTTPVDDTWLDNAQAHINGLFDGIQQEAFEPSPSPACNTCDFLRFCDVGTAFVENNAD
jgi:DNA helicase-2/ATP-dependent DNA helicase PcrA